MNQYYKTYKLILLLQYYASEFQTQIHIFVIKKQSTLLQRLIMCGSLSTLSFIALYPFLVDPIARLSLRKIHKYFALTFSKFYFASKLKV
jgi:hypothetical protein